MKGKMKKIDLSIIVPVFNVEKYLTDCLDSLLKQCGIHMEIIIIDDGSTDRSFEIAEQYFRNYDYIKVVHRENAGVSSARNTGLKIAQGEYIIFIDSDDRIKENSLCELFNSGIEQNADIVMGNVIYCYEDGDCDNPKRPVPDDMKYIILSGSEAFSGLIKSESYHPGAYCYMYKKEYINSLSLRFDESLSYCEDELFTSLALCQAERVYITGLAFYFYRQRAGSAVYSMSCNNRVSSLMYVANYLSDFANRFEYCGKNGELKSWLYVKVFNIYFHAFNFLQHVKDSSFVLPHFKMDLFWRNCNHLSPDAQQACREHYNNASFLLIKYINWRLSDWVMPVNFRYKGNKLLLFYNIREEELAKIKQDIPADWIITIDRKYFSQAHAVVFYLPQLHLEIGDDLEKREGQIWVAWYDQPEENYYWLVDDEAKELFDLRMTYKQEAEIVYPNYRVDNFASFVRQDDVERKINKAFLYLPDHFTRPEQKEYLKELMKYTEIDSFGSFCNNKKLVEYPGKMSDIYRNYKFVIALENFEDSDYVTDVFYNPILSFSVPVYWGAPNIKDYAPGKNCFVDARQFDNPKELANFINQCYEDDSLYSKFFRWKNKPFLPSFQQKTAEQKIHPFIRLLTKLNGKIVEKEYAQSNALGMPIPQLPR